VPRLDIFGIHSRVFAAPLAIEIKRGGRRGSAAHFLLKVERWSDERMKII